MSEIKEYIVTAINFEVLDDLCNDIESPGGNLYVPNRAVEVANPRHISQNTHYYLTDEEADLLRKDPRVLCVTLLPEQLGLEPTPFYEQFGDWDKSNTNNSAHKNWGLLRVNEGQQRSNWGGAGWAGTGVGGTASQNASIKIDYEGKDVDVVIVDGFANPDHPEFAVNANGSGGSRVTQFNWLSLTPQVTGGAAGTYTYGPYIGNGASVDGNNNHGCHVAGTVAGNTQGWARRANIYNIYAYGLQISTTSILDYIRIWHRNKPINPITGIKNPTIINNSWGYTYRIPTADVTSINYRGQTYNPPFTTNNFANFGLRVFSDNTVRLTSLYLPVDVDIIACINEGIIVVGAASNNFAKNDSTSGADYNNYVTAYSSNYFYNRGATPGNSGDSICVGAIDSLSIDYKAPFSNCGPEIDVYAPGVAIMSSFNSSASYGGTTDPRNASFIIGKISGTSMASPQVAGFLACLLEIYPNMTQSQAKEYLYYYSKQNQITNTGGGPSDFTDLQGSVNRYLTYVKERLDAGEVYPKLNYKSRPNTGITFPRTRILRYGR